MRVSGWKANLAVSGLANVISKTRLLPCSKYSSHLWTSPAESDVSSGETRRRSLMLTDERIEQLQNLLTAHYVRCERAIR